MFALLTVYEVIEPSDQKVLAASLCLTTVRIKVNMT